MKHYEKLGIKIEFKDGILLDPYNTENPFTRQGLYSLPVNDFHTDKGICKELEVLPTGKVRYIVEDEIYYENEIKVY